MLIFAKEESIPPNVILLVNKILQANSFHAGVIKKAFTLLEPPEIQLLEDYLVFCMSQGLTLDYLAHCYGTFMADVTRETIYFQEHKKYRHSTFAEVANSVYFNNAYMSLYMNGVLITQFFWPNHLQLFRFFRKTLPKNKTGNYLEIGPGHGYFLMTAMEHSSYTEFKGIDISETSINQTSKLMEMKGFEKTVQLYCADFLKIPLTSSSFDAIVMGELLEHVENPQDFLKKISFIAQNNAYIFVTTCINAPVIDHIYLFKDLKQIEDLFAQCGLQIKEQCILPYIDKTVEECIEHSLAINVGYVLEKK